VLWRADKDAEAIEVLKPVVLQTTHPAPYETLAASMLTTDGDTWQAMVYLLEAARYQKGRAYITRSLGRSLLWYAERPGWALRYLKQAVESDPDDAYAHYLLAATYAGLHDIAKSEAEYRISMQDRETDDLRRDSVHELVDLLIGARHFKKALAEVDVLNREYPGFAKGWKDRAVILGGLKADGGMEAMQKYVQLVDRTDPIVRAEAETIERQLGQPRARIHAK
jgi:tetratricopeptide (TPR) repeat protein